MKLEEIEKIVNHCQKIDDWIYNPSITDTLLNLLPRFINVTKAAQNTADSIRWAGIERNEGYEHHYVELIDALEDLEL